MFIMLLMTLDIFNNIVYKESLIGNIFNHFYFTMRSIYLRLLVNNSRNIDVDRK